MIELERKTKEALANYTAVELKTFIDATYHMTEKTAGQGEVCKKWYYVRLAAIELMESKMSEFLNAL